MTRSGISQGETVCRVTATRIPITRMTGSAIRNIRTLIQNPSRTAGNASVAWCQSKNVAWTRGQPGEEVTRTPTKPIAMTVTAVAVSPRRRRIRRSDALAFQLVAGSATSRSLQHRYVDHVREPVLLKLFECAVRLERAERLIDARQQLAALLRSASRTPRANRLDANWPVIVPCGISTAVM